MLPDPTLGDSTTTFLEAGRIFRFKGYLVAALTAFERSRSCASQLEGDVWRRSEIDSLRSQAEVWLTLSEIASSSSPLKKNSNIRAADAQLQAAWQSEDLGVFDDARAFYSSAAHRYQLGGELRFAAGVYAGEACDLSEQLKRFD
jgi:hypothetical protein